MRLICNSQPFVISVLLATTLNGCGGGDSSNAVAPGLAASFVVTTTVNSGSGAIEPQTATVTAGANVEFRLQPAQGHVLSSVSGCNGVLNDNNYRVSNVNSNCNVSANFTAISNTYTITTSVSQGGSINPKLQTVLEGNSATFNVDLAAGYVLSDIQGCNGTLSGSRYHVTNVRANCVVTAVFADTRKAPSQLAYSLDGENANLRWVGSTTQGYKLYIAEQPFGDSKDPNLAFTTINTKDATATIQLFKSYNHLFVKIAAIYDGTEVLSTEQLEIVHNYQPRGSLNDTGITYCLNHRVQASDCILASSERQDGNVGRDAAAVSNALIKTGLGNAGFDFSKVDRSGKLLPHQKASWNHNGSESDGTQWSCARDNLTGLIWEIKTETGIRAKTNQFTWYQELPTSNGGKAGSLSFDACQQTICNTGDYIKYLNEIKLCGSDQWRLPRRAELLGIIINHGASPRLDPLIFPDLLANTTYWSSNSYMPDINNSWAVTTNSGIVVWYPKSKPLNVRLVHSD